MSEPEDDQEECCVYECEEPRAPDDCYCPHHALVANDMERLYQGMVKAGMVEGR